MQLENQFMSGNFRYPSEWGSGFIHPRVQQFGNSNSSFPCSCCRSGRTCCCSNLTVSGPAAFTLQFTKVGGFGSGDPFGGNWTLPLGGVNPNFPCGSWALTTCSGTGDFQCTLGFQLSCLSGGSTCGSYLLGVNYTGEICSGGTQPFCLFTSWTGSGLPLGMACNCLSGTFQWTGFTINMDFGSGPLFDTLPCCGLQSGWQGVYSVTGAPT